MVTDTAAALAFAVAGLWTAGLGVDAMIVSGGQGAVSMAECRTGSACRNGRLLHQTRRSSNPAGSRFADDAPPGGVREFRRPVTAQPADLAYVVRGSPRSGASRAGGRPPPGRAPTTPRGPWPAGATGHAGPRRRWAPCRGPDRGVRERRTRGPRAPGRGWPRPRSGYVLAGHLITSSRRPTNRSAPLIGWRRRRGPPCRPYGTRWRRRAGPATGRSRPGRPGLQEDVGPGHPAQDQLTGLAGRRFCSGLGVAQHDRASLDRRADVSLRYGLETRRRRSRRSRSSVELPRPQPASSANSS